MILTNIFLFQRRLCTAAKKALSKIPTKNIKADDKVSTKVYYLSPNDSLEINQS